MMPAAASGFLASASAWAKSRLSGDGRTEFLSLHDHCCDVAAVFAAFLQLPTVAARLAGLAGRELTPADCQRFGVLVALHDAGKANVGFQNRIQGRTPEAGHIAPLVSLLDADTHGESESQKRRLREALEQEIGFAALQSWGALGDIAPLVDAILAHHGRLPAPGAVERWMWQATPHYDPFTALAELRQSIRAWFPAAFGPIAAPLPCAPRFVHALAGLVMLADWLGSDGDRFRFPPDGAPTGRDRMAYSRAVAAQVLRDRFLDPNAWRQIASNLSTDFDDLFPGIGPPLWPQAAMLGLPLPEPSTGRVIVLEAETGSGKTEAALIHFMQLFRAGHVDGMYFALPTRAAAMQIHQRIHAALRRVFGAAAPPVGLAVPGYLRVDDRDATKLPDYRVLWPDDAGDTLHDRGWAVEHSKRYLAGAVMVGTVDQLLLGALRVRHAHLRSGPMLRLLLVVDEVHASDAYMESLLRSVLQQHRAAGGHALLLSATLGSAARQRLMATGRAPNLSFADAVALPYPHCSASHGAVPKIERRDGEKRPEKHVEIELLDSAGAEKLADRALDAARAGARVLVIRNRVGDAQALQRVLQESAGTAGDEALLFACERRPAPHHARFAAEDRRLLDAALETLFGKGAAGGGVVAVTTQTAEQSLDIDADLMLTDLCPADVLLQRIGRLHRHARRRPSGFESARLVVFAPPIAELGRLLGRKGEVRGRLLGLGKIYPDLVGLAATRSFLCQSGGRLTIPAQNRAFVEAATHPDALDDLAGRLAEPWKQHREVIKGIGLAAGAVARLNAIEWTKPLAPPWPGAEPPEVIRTRLGLDTRMVALEQPVTGPYGEPIRTFLIPHWMLAASTSDDAEITDVTPLGDGALAFNFGPRRFRYSTLGLEAET